jgi:hypothetical protein
MPRDPSKFPKADKPIKFSDEEDTKPDVFQVHCPACADSEGHPQGEIVTETWFEGHLHKTSRQLCWLCFGKRWVDRASLAKWGAHKATGGNR